MMTLDQAIAKVQYALDVVDPDELAKLAGTEFTPSVRALLAGYEAAEAALKDPMQAYKTLRNWCKKSNCVYYSCPLEQRDGLHCLCHETQPCMWPELQEGERKLLTPKEAL